MARQHRQQTQISTGLALGFALTAVGCTAELGAETGSGEWNSAGMVDGGSVDEVNEGTPPAAGTTGPQVFLLTRRQIEGSLAELLGTASVGEDELQPDSVSAGYSAVGSGISGLSDRGVELLETLVLRVTGEAFNDEARRVALVGCTPATASDPCAQSFLEGLGVRAFRRPLSAEEIERHRELLSEVSALFDGDVWQGLRYTTAALFQSPRFVYQLIYGESDPAEPDNLRLTSYELASRLAYFLTQAPPDAALMEAAEKGELVTDAGLEAAFERLRAEPQHRAGLEVYCSEYFGLGSLRSANKSPELFPEIRPEDFSMMEREALAFCTGAAEGEDFRKALVADETEVNGRLLSLYEYEGAAPDDEWSVVTMPFGARVGILTSAGFAASHAQSDRTSPTLRGRFVRETLLCQKVPDPPDDVAFEGIDPAADRPATLRGRLEQHASDPACVACHEMMDPIGFGLEHFDAVGLFRDGDAGVAIDATGELDGAAFDGAGELSMAIANHEAFPACVATQLFRAANGRVAGAAETAALSDAGQAFSLSGFDFDQVLRRTVLADAFRMLTLPRSSP